MKKVILLFKVVRELLNPYNSPKNILENSYIYKR